MRLGTDPRLPILSGQDYQRNLYARLYDIFRSHAAAVNAVDDTATKNASDIATNTTNIATKAAQTDFAELKNNAQWYGVPIGVVFGLDESLGSPVPPSNNVNFRFIRLTAADTYNSNALTSESVSGSAPLVTATAVISLAKSPLNGKTVHLLNTENRFTRFGVSGTLQDDAIRNITGSLAAAGAVAWQSAAGTFKLSGTTAPIPAQSTSVQPTTLNFDASLVVPVATENRPRNIALSAWMRIL